MTQKLPFKEPGRAHKRRNNTGRLTFHFVLFALLGVMLLLFVLPVIALLLLADFLVWRAKRPERLSSGRSDVKRREKNNE